MCINNVGEFTTDNNENSVVYRIQDCEFAIVKRSKSTINLDDIAYSILNCLLLVEDKLKRKEYDSITTLFKDVIDNMYDKLYTEIKKNQNIKEYNITISNVVYDNNNNNLIVKLSIIDDKCSLLDIYGNFEVTTIDITNIY